jgi:hypothetical protein
MPPTLGVATQDLAVEGTAPDVPIPRRRMWRHTETHRYGIRVEVWRRKVETHVDVVNVTSVFRTDTHICCERCLVTQISNLTIKTRKK